MLMNYLHNLYIQDGVKLLNTCLEGERSITFCRFLSQNTALLKLDDIPNGRWNFDAVVQYTGHQALQLIQHLTCPCS